MGGRKTIKWDKVITSKPFKVCVIASHQGAGLNGVDFGLDS